MSETFMEEARQAAAQCWCDTTTSHIDMIPELAEAVAYRIAAWMDTAAQFARNEEYYRQERDKQQAQLRTLAGAIISEHNTPNVHVDEDGFAIVTYEKNCKCDACQLTRGILNVQKT